MIKFLKWDSDFFKINIANLDIENNSIDLILIENFIKKNNLKLIQSLILSDKINLINKLESNNFKLEESVVTFIKKINEYKENIEPLIRIAKIEDLSYIKTYLSGIFKESRYKRIVKKELVNKFYYIWVKKAILGEFDDICFVYEIEEKPVGFITIKKNEDSGIIGLIAVSSDFQGKRIGKKLIEYSENYLLDNGISKFYVKTQGSNILAQNFYIKNNFLIKDLKYWLYRIIK